MAADRKRALILLLSLTAFFTAAFTGFLILRSSVDCEIMSYKEKIMFQIKEEQQVYSDTLFEEAEVIRPWYGLDPTEWLYRVRLKDSGEVLVYEYDNGVFVRTGR